MWLPEWHERSLMSRVPWSDEEERLHIVGKDPVAVQGPVVRGRRARARTTGGPRTLGSSLAWLLSKDTQEERPVPARTLRRRNELMWGLWPPVPLADQVHDVVHLDGIHLHRQAVVLITIAGGHVIGWYVARRETGAAWSCLMSRIAPPLAVVCDGCGGLLKALRDRWPDTAVQRCLFHVCMNITELTGVRPRLEAGKTAQEGRRGAQPRARRGLRGRMDGLLQPVGARLRRFRGEKSEYRDGTVADQHARLVKARRMIRRRIKEGHLFTFLRPPEGCAAPIPPTNNLIESVERVHPRHAPPSPRAAAGAQDQGDLLVVPQQDRTSRDRRVARQERDHRPADRGALRASLGDKPAGRMGDVRHPHALRHRHRLE